jgi:tetratricopeptide (TPR) repeat protein
VRALACLRRGLRTSLWAVVVVLLKISAAPAQQDAADWQQQVREKVQLHQFDAALNVVSQRLERAPLDLEAHGWRARLEAWQGHWGDAETEYRRVLEQVPNDTDILCGLSDVLLWQGKAQQALNVIDHAREIAGTDPEILLRRARILRVLNDRADARGQYQQILKLSPENQEARNELADLATESMHEFRAAFDGSTFSYTGPAEDEVLFLTSHWNARFTTAFTTGFYQRFGQQAADLVVNPSFRFAKNDSFSVGAAIASHQLFFPEEEVFFEYGHGLRLPNRWIKGLEASYLQHWLWYQGAHVLTLSVTQLYSLPKAWTWSITVTGARTGFVGSGVDWVPSGSTKIEFPLRPNLAGNVAFANGTEDFAQVDQIGQFSARTFAGGLKYRFAPGQDVSGYIAVQRRSDAQTENSYGVSYGLHF